MAFNFGNVLGSAAFQSLNAFLNHNASKDGYAKANRYEVVIGLPSGATQASVDDAGMVDGIKESIANCTFSPPFSMDMVPEETKLALGWF